MRIRDVIDMLNRMKDDRIIADYAIAGAVGATFYLDPIATLDVDVFVGMEPPPDSLIVDPRPIFKYLMDRGARRMGNTSS